MDNLNYHHLRYFRAVAHEGNLTRTAERSNLSQSALSSQIKVLEERLGYALFERVGRKLILTEVGQIVLDYADRIFATGEELVAHLSAQEIAGQPFRVGAISTLSRNFQLQFLKPVLEDSDTQIILRSGNEENLLDALSSLALDIVLTTHAPMQADANKFTAHKIAEQAVSAHGTPQRLKHKTLAELLSSEPIIVPTESSISQGFESLVSRLNIKPHIIAEVDDMAMVRLLARNNVGVAIAPTVVLADEIKSGRLETAPFDLETSERFYAVTMARNFPHPNLVKLLQV